jgi:sec-independent protein translocase protein TatC
MAFAYYFILPTGLPVLLNFLPVPTEIRPSSYMRFVTGLMFWIGLVFEFPLVSYLLASLGVISARTLLNNWRIAVVIMAVLAAVITPTIDPINMMLVMGPLLVLYGFSVVLSLLAGGRRRRSRDRAEQEG